MLLTILWSCEVYLVIDHSFYSLLHATLVTDARLVAHRCRLGTKVAVYDFCSDLGLDWILPIHFSFYNKTAFSFFRSILWITMAKPKKQTREERLRKKRLAEKKRYENIKNNAELWAEKQEKNRKSYLRRN